MRDLCTYSVGLLIDPERTIFYPFSTHGFEYGQGSINAIRQRSLGNVFFADDACLYRFTDISYAEEGLFRKVLRATNYGGGHICVKRERHDVALDDLKVLIHDCLKNYIATAEPDETWLLIADGFEKSANSIRNAPDFRALFNLLRLPAVEDCLDAL